MKGRILLAESSLDLAENLKVLLSAADDFRLVGQSASGLDAMRKMTSLAPDVLILDLSLPDMSAMEIGRWAGRLFPETRVVLLSSHDLPEYRLAAARLKAAAFVNKADLCRKLPQVLARLRREQLVKEGERGAILPARWAQELRCLAAWITQSARARNQVPVWRFIHLAMAVLSLELIGGTPLGQEATPALIVTGWGLLLAALVRDIQSLLIHAGPTFMFANGER